jgi:hypothetical protein
MRSVVANLAASTDFADEAEILVRTYGASAIQELNRALSLGEHTDARRTFVALLGELDHPLTRPERWRTIASYLASQLAGDRVAAASALGRMGGAPSLSTLRHRLTMEKNKTVRAMIEAQVRSLSRTAEHDGSPAASSAA